jgi:hypothetical protein
MREGSRHLGAPDRIAFASVRGTEVLERARVSEHDLGPAESREQPRAPLGDALALGAAQEADRPGRSGALKRLLGRGGQPAHDPPVAGGLGADEVSGHRPRGRPGGVEGTRRPGMHERPAARRQALVGGVGDERLAEAQVGLRGQHAGTS